MHYTYIDGKRVSNHAMKDWRTFIKMQEAVGKQVEARNQGYGGTPRSAMNNTPPPNQPPVNGAAQTQGQQNQSNQNNGGYVPSKGHIAAMIQPVPKSNEVQKSISRQVNLAITLHPLYTNYLHWSEQPIEFSREDHPIIVPRAGNAPLILKPQIGGYDVDRVFMDAESGINLIYAKTLRAMHISLEFLKPMDCSFHGIVPGSENYPLGQIALDVCFGNRHNYRREKLEFEVMGWPSQYHVILGRPTFSCFMAVPHYTYLVLKMPGPNRIVIVKGIFELSDICDKEFHKMAQTFDIITEYGQPKEGPEGKVPPSANQPMQDKVIDNAPEAKKL
jgi:hypothetical protein